MNRRYDDLWTSAADDGASCPVGVYANRERIDAEVDQLMNAWLCERTKQIECSLVLDQAHRLIAGLLAKDEISPRHRRQASRLIRVIQNLQKTDADDLRP